MLVFRGGIDYEKTVDIQILNIEEGMFDIIINYAQTSSNGCRKVCVEMRSIRYILCALETKVDCLCGILGQSILWCA